MLRLYIWICLLEEVKKRAQNRVFGQEPECRPDQHLGQEPEERCVI